MRTSPVRCCRAFNILCSCRNLFRKAYITARYHHPHMPVVFVSHSSKDDDAVTALEVWLHANGFTEIFVDHHGIAGGDRWREELRASAAACRIIICLVTESWLGSQECFGEFVAACYTGKRIIPLFLLPSSPTLDTERAARLAKVSAEYEGIKLNDCTRLDGVLDLTPDSEVSGRLRDGLRAAGANSRVGLDPEAFAVDRKLRPTPFPGLASLAPAREPCTRAFHRMPANFRRS
jgi:TIR domain